MAGTALRGRLTWQVANVVAVTVETASVRTIMLDVPDWPGHQAGQHLDIRLTDEDGYVAERSYSIASAPGEPVAITVERLDDGEVSPYLTDELRAGDDLEGSRAVAPRAIADFHVGHVRVGIGAGQSRLGDRGQARQAHRDPSD